jgi:hypothetical protein
MLRYVEPLNVARIPLADFVSTLQEVPRLLPHAMLTLISTVPPLPFASHCLGLALHAPRRLAPADLFSDLIVI